MTRKTEQLKISAQELDVIASALETQSKILGMQASAGGHGALARLNAVKTVMARIASQREEPRQRATCESRWVGMLRFMGQAT